MIMALLTVTILVVLTVPASVSSYQHINVSGECLEHYLCNDTVSCRLSNTTLYLTDGPFLLPNKSCVISNIKNLAIIGISSEIYLFCPNNSQGGITFFNVSNLTLGNFWFNGTCSAPLPNKVAHKYDNSSTFHFGPNQESTIYISNCRDVAVEYVSFYNPKAFSILLVNAVGKVSISHVIKNSTLNLAGCSSSNMTYSDYSCAGSGVVFYYYDTSELDTAFGDTNITVVNSTFKDIANVHFPRHYPKQLCFIDDINSRQSSLPLVTATGLTFLFTHTTFNVYALVLNCNLTINSSLSMLTVFNNKPGLARVSLAQVNFFNISVNNTHVFHKIGCAGSVFRIAINYNRSISTAVIDTPITATNVHITNVLSLYPSIYISIFSPQAIKIFLTFQYLTCHEVHTSEGGSCVTAENLYGFGKTPGYGNVTLNFTSVTAVKNILVNENLELCASTNHYYLNAVFKFARIDTVIIEGTEQSPSIFKNNHMSAIVAYASSLKLGRRVIFYSSHGVRGGAMALYDSYLILKEKVNATFTSNTGSLEAEAIYAYRTPGGYSTTFCVIQLETSLTDPVKIGKSFHIKFNDSKKAGGVQVTVTPAYNCKQSYSNIAMKYLKDVYSNITANTTIIRSEPTKTILCKGRNVNVPYFTYPGVSIKISVAVVDFIGNIVPSNVHARLYGNELLTLYYILNNDEIKHFPHHNCCSNYSYSVMAHTHKCRDVNSTVGSLVLFVPNSKEYLKLHLHVQKCPLGFQLTAEGTCGCNDFIVSISKRKATKPSCKIQLQNSSLSHCDHNDSNCIGNISDPLLLQYGWIGLAIDSDDVMLYSPVCPFGSCMTGKTFIDAFKWDNKCIGNRRGQVCSECIPGYSIAFGTKYCMKCRNMWLWTILLYAVLGLVLVLFLFIAHFTIDQGTVVGIALFGNLAIFGFTLLHDLDNDSFGILGYFLSMLNLDIGISVCFYDGMTEVVKTALQFAFPVYVWGIVLFIIFISKRSTFISNLTSDNSVQVLITLVQLSFVKILRNVFYICSPLILYRMANSTSPPYQTKHIMWYGNATIPYSGTTGHCLLLIAALVFTIGFLLPYVVMSFVAPYCFRYRIVNHFRVIYETQYGPYKDKYRYWFGIRLMLLVTFSAIYMLTQGTDPYKQVIIYQSLLVCFFGVQCWIRPLKTTATNMIDSFCLGIVTMGYVLITFFFKNESLSITYVAACTLASVIFIIFILTILYHMVWFIHPVRHLLTNYKDKAVRLWNSRKARFKSMVDVSKDANNYYGATIQQSYNCDDYREPLLSSTMKT